MLRNFGISLLMLGLLAAGYDGFRQRERVRAGAAGGATATTETGEVHISDISAIPPR